MAGSTLIGFGAFLLFGMFEYSCLCRVYRDAAADLKFNIISFAFFF